MFKRICNVGPILAVCATSVVMAAPARAQSIAGCKVTALTDPPREVLRCGSGLKIEAEQGAQYRLVDQNKLEVTSRGVLIDVTPGRRGGFQVLTPHAIASVRGTLYAVDVKEEKTETDVFVSRGRVGVENRSTRERATLGPGEGSDVIPGKPLDAHVWAAERAQKLMGRFGR
ncbi:MAG: FecR domain-containing protein [Methylobacteriaceae bacterium]|nr:FecR domain-containing protein [Methylobacteriaceae bacterium]